MIYERKDGLQARILAEVNDQLLIECRWPANFHDRRKFSPLRFSEGTRHSTLAINTTVVSKDYFEKRYVVTL